MNIAAIQTFLTVIRTGNLNRAAEQMNITQSAVTARLDALEQALGARLLVRSRKGASLTKPGFAFLDQAEVIVRSWENARARTNLPRGVTRLFSFVCHPSLWSGLGEAWVNDLRNQQVETAIEVWAGLPGDATRWLQTGMSDAALLPEPMGEPGLNSREFARDRLVLVTTAPDTPTAWDQDYIYVDYGPDLRAQHAETWPADETASLSFSCPDWALAHLITHGGTAYLPARMLAEGTAGARLYRVDGAPEFTHLSYLSWRASSEPAFPWLAAPQPQHMA
ncbi:LysR family transcriptional regulator [Roseovarius aestuarii]|uniref:HTH-type transcriptional regulator GltR n=1 Tax=Roseovarius aestuarii TaxID=475083 RepID=A0A1X7BWH6_9RHOB|nr:LysR family transcriptional regulator [Roseovarius aestuarii]SMC13579.1 HTH-type transcriptional regulator GltR [Roseovarius aestuarii]